MDITIIMSRDGIELSQNVLLMLKTMPIEIVVKCQNQDEHLQTHLNVISVEDACC